MFIVIVGSLLLTLVIHGETRFKLPFLPFIFIMAAYFVSNLSQHKDSLAAYVEKQIENALIGLKSKF